MLCIQDQEYFDSVMEFARTVGMAEQLQEQLDYLANFACRDEKGVCDPCRTRCKLFPDRPVGWHEPHPHNFYFVMERRQPDGSYKFWFDGGLIFHGLPGHYEQGGSVQLVPSPGWTVHT